MRTAVEVKGRRLLELECTKLFCAGLERRKLLKGNEELLTIYNLPYDFVRHG